MVARSMPLVRALRTDASASSGRWVLAVRLYVTPGTGRDSSVALPEASRCSSRASIPMTASTWLESRLPTRTPDSGTTL